MTEIVATGGVGSEAARSRWHRTGASRDGHRAPDERRGRSEDEGLTVEKRRVRCAGGGRRRSIKEDPQLLVALEALVEPSTRGDPESAVRWTCKRLRVLAGELVRIGHTVSYRADQGNALFEHRRRDELRLQLTTHWKKSLN